MKAPLPTNEQQRLAKLLSYDILDTDAEHGYDDLTELAAYICGTPISLVSLVDQERQWFKSKVGIDATETHRDHAFCAHAILQDDVFEVPNATQDHRFADNPLVQHEPDIRFYAGAPLISSDGYAVGTLCVIDREPRQLSQAQRDALQVLGRQVVNQLELRLKVKELRAEVRERTEVEQQLRATQAQMIQQEKLSSLGQLVGGVAHEINNPVTFIHGNIGHVQSYCEDLLTLVAHYQADYPEPSAAIADLYEDIDLDYLKADLPDLFVSMKNGVNRIKHIVKALQTFSSADRVGVKPVNIQDNLESVLMLVAQSLQAQNITVEREYSPLPKVEIDPGEFNQALMNIVMNAIDAFDGVEQHDRILRITTAAHDDRVQIAIADNGKGMTPAVQAKIFDPFFSTKAIGSGSGMGLSMSHTIITQAHRGHLTCESAPGRGTTFILELPYQHQPHNPLAPVSMPATLTYS
jgi:signal transduction histidine kinase